MFVKGARYDKMMEAFGGVGVNATSPDELKRAVNEAMDSGKPTLINAIINFLIVAAVVYFVLVLPIKKIQERRKRGEEAGPAEPTEVELLKEIRDLLTAQQDQQNHQTVVQSSDVRNPKV